MTRILFLTHYAQYYGANRSLVDLIDGLQELDYQIEVIVAGDGEMLDVLKQKGIPYHVAYFNTFVYRKNRISYFKRKQKARQNAHILNSLEKVARHFSPHIVYSNSSVFDMGVRLAEKIGCPHIWHIREMAALHYRYNFYPNKEKFVALLKSSAMLIAISKAVANHVLIEEGVTKYKVLHDAVFAKSKFDSLQLTVQEEKKGQLIFGNIGMLHPSKNQATVIKAFAIIAPLYPNALLWIVGDGQPIYKKYLQYLIIKHGLSRQVKMLGYVQNMDILYPQMDAVIVASEYEGMGRTTIEGMAYQKPIIGLNSGATPELVKHEQRGLIYQENDAETLAESIKYILENKKNAAEMGVAGRSFVAQNFMIEDYAEKIHKIIQEVRSKTD